MDQYITLYIYIAQVDTDRPLPYRTSHGTVLMYGVAKCSCCHTAILFYYLAHLSGFGWREHPIRSPHIQYGVRYRSGTVLRYLPSASYHYTMNLTICKLITLFTTAVAFQGTKVSPTFHRFPRGTRVNRCTAPQPLYSVEPTKKEGNTTPSPSPPKAKRASRKAGSAASKNAVKAQKRSGESNKFLKLSDGHRIAYTEFYDESSNEVVVCKYRRCILAN